MDRWNAFHFVKGGGKFFLYKDDAVYLVKIESDTINYMFLSGKVSILDEWIS